MPTTKSPPKKASKAAPVKKSRSGSRAPSNPKTKAQRLSRVKEITEKIDRHLAEVESWGAERDRIVGELREVDGATFREIAFAAGKSEQAIHKAFGKRRSNGHA